MNVNFPSAPILPAYATSTQLIVWCRFCKSWHLHGLGPKGEPILGHRWAHCRSDAHSPYDKTGYILEYAGLATPEIMKDYRCRRPKGLPVILEAHKQGGSA